MKNLITLVLASVFIICGAILLTIDYTNVPVFATIWTMLIGVISVGCGLYLLFDIVQEPIDEPSAKQMDLDADYEVHMDELYCRLGKDLIELYKNDKFDDNEKSFRMSIYVENAITEENIIINRYKFWSKEEMERYALAN